jgi:tetratricopeptide (TPR) repeat protein
LEQLYANRQWTMALAASQQALIADPTDQTALVFAGRSAFQLQRWSEAAEYYRRVGDALSDEDLWNWGEAAGRVEHWNEALTAMSKLYERTADQPRVLRQMAVFATESGQEDSAIKLAERLAEFPEQAAAAYGIIGSIHQREQRYADAADAFAKALERDPEGKTLPLSAGELNTAMGWNLLQVGEVERAQVYLAKALEIRPADGMAPWLMGKARLALDDRDGAYAWWIESLRKHHHNPDALLSLGMLAIEQGEFESAVEWLTLAVRDAPGYSYPRQVLGNAYIRLGQVERGKSLLAEADALRADSLAERDEERIVRASPESAIGLIARSNQALRKKQPDRARELLEQAVRKYDDIRAKQALSRFDDPGGPKPVVIRSGAPPGEPNANANTKKQP